MQIFDVAEVALLNNVLAAVNLEGNRFFTSTHWMQTEISFNHGTAGRAPWFGTAYARQHGTITTSSPWHDYARR